MAENQIASGPRADDVPGDTQVNHASVSAVHLTAPRRDLGGGCGAVEKPDEEERELLAEIARLEQVRREQDRTLEELLQSSRGRHVTAMQANSSALAGSQRVRITPAFMKVVYDGRVRLLETLGPTLYHVRASRERVKLAQIKRQRTAAESAGPYLVMVLVCFVVLVAWLAYLKSSSSSGRSA